MQARLLTIRAVLLACAALVATPAVAQADGLDICVNASGCTAPNTVSTLEAALSIADDDVQKDTIHIGAGTLVPSGANTSFTVSTLVDIVGAGRDQTILDAPSNLAGEWTLFMPAASKVSDLAVKMSNTGYYGLILNGGTAERFAITADPNRPVTAQNGRAIVLNTGINTLKDGTITMPLGAPHDEWAVWAGGSAATIDNVTMIADNAIVAQGSGMSVVHSALTGHRVFVQNGAGDSTLSNSVLRAKAGSTGTPMGINNQANGAAVTTVTTNHVTIVGPAAGEGLRVATTCGGGSATTNFDTSTVSGFPFSSTQTGCAGYSFPTTCPAPVANSANVQWNYSHRDNNTDNNQGCFGQNNPRTGSPGFVSATDLRPRQPSPLIDTGDPAPDSGGEKDFNGAPRVVDGDGTGGARRDIGAYEYQRTPPTVTASVTPSTGPLAQLFAFSALGQDADGETIQYIWTFDDGSVYSKASVDKTFTTFGTHSGEVQAIDAAGLTVKGTASVTVANPPVPTPQPTPSPTPAPKDTTAPKITVVGGTLRADKKGRVKLTIRCPATESAPCGIALAAASTKKIALRAGKRKRISPLGSGRGSVPQGKSAKVTLKLSRAAFSYLKRKKKLPATFTIVAKDVAGNAATTILKATIRPAKK